MQTTIGRRVSVSLISSATLLFTAACGGGSVDSATAGITDDTVVIGTSGPVTGDYAVDGLYVQGMRAAIGKVNAAGGVTMADGKARKIDLRVYDDGYDPARTLANCRQFVERDNGFAMVMILGTPTGLACKEYMEDAEVPSVLHHSSSQAFSGSRKDLPWQTGFPLSYVAEGAIVIEAIKEKLPDADIAMLRYGGDAGQEYHDGVKKAIAGSPMKLVADSVYTDSDTSVSSHMATLLSKRPDALLQFTSGAPVSQAIGAVHESGQQILDFLVSTSATVSQVEPAGAEAANGTRSVQWAKDPSDPAYAKDQAVLDFQELVTEYGTGKDLDKNLGAMVGYIGAEIFIEALGKSEPTRASLMDALHSMKELSVPGLLPGVSITTGPEDPFLIESGRIAVYDGTSWVIEDRLYSYEGRTPIL